MNKRIVGDRGDDDPSIRLKIDFGGMLIMSRTMDDEIQAAEEGIGKVSEKYQIDFFMGFLAGLTGEKKGYPHNSRNYYIKKAWEDGWYHGTEFHVQAGRLF